MVGFFEIFLRMQVPKFERMVSYFLLLKLDTVLVISVNCLRGTKKNIKNMINIEVLCVSMEGRFMREGEILQFAQKIGYDGFQFHCKWNSWDCYEPIMNANEVSYVGYLLVVMVKGDEIRVSTDEESLKICTSSM